MLADELEQDLGAAAGTEPVSDVVAVAEPVAGREAAAGLGDRNLEK